MPHEPRRVLITGAGSGIGRALACDAASRGMQVALCGRRADALAATVAMAGANDAALVIPADIAAPAGRQAVRLAILDAWGGLDILVNNAGLVVAGPLGELEDASIASVLAINVAAPIALTRDLLPLLEASGQGRVVNVGSVLGDIPCPDFALYSASKFALRGFSDALRREWRGRVGVTYAAPRATRTPAAAGVADFLGNGTGMDDPRAVAQRIWDAALQGRDAVYPRGAEPFFVLLQRLFPRLVDLGMSRTPRHGRAVPSDALQLTQQR